MCILILVLGNRGLATADFYSMKNCENALTEAKKLSISIVGRCVLK
jgi:hypothetical protein